MRRQSNWYIWQFPEVVQIAQSRQIPLDTFVVDEIFGIIRDSAPPHTKPSMLLDFGAGETLGVDEPEWRNLGIWKGDGHSYPC